MTYQEFISEWNDDAQTIHVQTSGSTGAPKKLNVRKDKMIESAKMTCDFLGLQPGDTALLCMNLDYIGAKMMVVKISNCLVYVGNLSANGIMRHRPSMCKPVGRQVRRRS